jgi:hypothetical protein
MYDIFDYMQIQGLPKVDYGCAVHTVYTELTTAAIRIDKSLDTLYQVCLPKLVSSLPSWVPDYSNTRYYLPIVVDRLGASGSSSATYSFSELNLVIRGTLIDTLCDVASSTSIAMASSRRGYNARMDFQESKNRRTGVLELLRTLQAWI